MANCMVGGRVNDQIIEGGSVRFSSVLLLIERGKIKKFFFADFRFIIGCCVIF